MTLFGIRDKAAANDSAGHRIPRIRSAGDGLLAQHPLLFYSGECTTMHILWLQLACKCRNAAGTRKRAVTKLKNRTDCQLSTPCYSRNACEEGAGYKNNCARPTWQHENLLSLDSIATKTTHTVPCISNIRQHCAYQTEGKYYQYPTHRS